MLIRINHGDSRYVYLPYHIKQTETFEAKGIISAVVHIQMNHLDDVFLCCNALIYSESGQFLAVVTGVTAKRALSQHVPLLLVHRVYLRPET